MKNKNIYLMYAIGFLQGMVFYGPIATLYREAQGVSILQITVIESISLILCLLLEFPWGMVADKIGYRNTILFCCVLYFISKLVFWQASDFFGFLLERVMLSIVIAGLSGVDTAFLYLSCKEGESQQVFGIYNSLGNAGLLFASLLFSLFVGSNYRMAGFLTVITYGISALLAFGLTEVEKGKQEIFSIDSILSLLGQTMKNRKLLLFLAGIACLNETHQTVTVFLNQLQYKKCGLGSSAMGYIYIFITIVGLCGAWSFGLTKKLGEFRFTALIYIFSGIACLLLAFTDKAWLSVFGIFLLRVCFSFLQPLQAELQNRQIITENRATALSINAVIIDSVGAGTNVAFGILAERNLSGAFLFGMALCVLGGAFVLRYISKTKKISLRLS